MKLSGYGFRYICTGILAIVSGVFASHATTGAETFKTNTVALDIKFPINSHVVYPDFADNARTLDSLRSIIKGADGNQSYKISDITTEVTSSPDGSMRKNLSLAKRRMNSICEYLNSKIDLPDSIHVRPLRSYIPWDEFRALVAQSNLEDCDEVIRISSVGSDDSEQDNSSRMARLKRLRNGRIWSFLKTDILPRLRKADILVFTIERIVQEQPKVEQLPETDGPYIGVINIDLPETPQPAQENAVEEEVQSDSYNRCINRWNISTNLAGWGLAIANLTGEYSFRCHWSAALSIYYSAWNYGTSTRKFRTFIFRPEIRYWFGSNQRGLFVDGHVQMAAFNFATPGREYRIQDRKGKHPALGGGVGIGYRYRFGQSRWSLEAQIGAGCYHLDYNRYVNRPNGKLVDNIRRTWFGIDNAALSVVYTFDNPKTAVK